MVYGTTPATPAFKNLRITGSGLTFQPVTVKSKELRADRMVGDLILVGKDAGGTLPIEVSYKSALDDMMPYQLMSDWVRTPVRDNNGTADSEITDVSATTGVFTIVTTGSSNTDFHFGAFAIGHLVRASGFTAAANNGLWRASATSATSVTLTLTSTADTAPAAAARLKTVGFRGASADITATATGLGSTALNFTLLGLASGMWIKIGGSAAGEQFATAALNGWARINGTITATALPLDNLPVGWTTDAGTGKTITVWVPDYIRNGTTKKSMTLEEQYQDLTAPEYNYYDGMLLDKTSISIKSKEVASASFEFVGSDVTNGTSRFAGATDVVAATNDVLNASSNVGQIAEGGTALSGVVLSVDLTLMNNKRRRNAVGAMSNPSDASGTFEVQGKMSLYYMDNTIRTKILAGTASSFNTRLMDTTAPNNSRAILIDIPRIKYSGGNPNVPGIDTDRTMDPGFEALYSSTFGYQFAWHRFEEVYQA